MHTGIGQNYASENHQRKQRHQEVDQKELRDKPGELPGIIPRSRHLPDTISRNPQSGNKEKELNKTVNIADNSNTYRLKNPGSIWKGKQGKQDITDR